MTTHVPQIGLLQLRRLVHEAVDHNSIRDIVTTASKLLAAIETFQEKAPPAAINAVTPHLTEMAKVLENMVEAPGSYVAKVKAEPKRVTLKAVKKESLARVRELVKEVVMEQSVPLTLAGVKKEYPDAYEEMINGPWPDETGEHRYGKTPEQRLAKLERDRFAVLGSGKGLRWYSYDQGEQVWDGAEWLYVDEPAHVEGEEYT